jgi:hypothetical protein
MAALPIGTSSSSRSAGQHEAADMLGQVARKAGQLMGQIEHARMIGLAGSSPASRMCLAFTSPTKRAPNGAGQRAVTSSVRPIALPTSRKALRGR